MAPGARSKFGALCSNLRCFESKFTVLKKVFVTLLGLFGAPVVILHPENCVPLSPHRYAPGCSQVTESGTGISVHVLVKLTLRGIATGVFGGLFPQTKLQDPPNWITKHYKSVEFYQISECQPPLNKRKAPYWKLSGDSSVEKGSNKTVKGNGNL